MKPQYKDHLTEWRPDYPPVFYTRMYSGSVFEVSEDTSNKQESINAFAIARNAIIKSMKP